MFICLQNSNTKAKSQGEIRFHKLEKRGPAKPEAQTNKESIIFCLRLTVRLWVEGAKCRGR
jgi:hypothetical protein